MKSYGIYDGDEYFATEVSGCTNPTEMCPDCPRWNKDCDGREKYNEIAEIEHYKHMACNMAFICDMMKPREPRFIGAIEND